MAAAYAAPSHSSTPSHRNRSRATAATVRTLDSTATPDLDSTAAPPTETRCRSVVKLQSRMHCPGGLRPEGSGIGARPRRCTAAAPPWRVQTRPHPPDCYSEH
eukprot:scaffold4394_cov113-Isochrysis_galbana.AAC.12